MRSSSIALCFRLGLLPLILTEPLSVAASADDQIRITTAEKWGTAFADEEISLSVRVDASAIPSGSILWSHSADGRTITRGEVPLQPDGESGATANVILRCPSLRENVIIETSVSAEYVPQGGKDAVASFERTITLFPKDAFSGRNNWAKLLDIELFDPAGKTTAVFQLMNLPHRKISNPAVLDDQSRAGILIVGEGTSLIKNRMLAEALLKAAASGRRVILLAPSEGSLPLPGTDIGIETRIPVDLRLARSQIISEFDKRLDAAEWRNTGHSVPAVGVSMGSDRRQVLLTFSEDAASWPWLTTRYPDGKGTLVMCGFRIIEHWEDGPTPRYLLLKILESLEDSNGG